MGYSVLFFPGDEMFADVDDSQLNGKYLLHEINTACLCMFIRKKINSGM